MKEEEKIILTETMGYKCPACNLTLGVQYNTYNTDRRVLEVIRKDKSMVARLDHNLDDYK